jgi:hypothetical protein
VAVVDLSGLLRPLLGLEDVPALVPLPLRLVALALCLPVAVMFLRLRRAVRFHLLRLLGILVRPLPLLLRRRVKENAHLLEVFAQGSPTRVSRLSTVLESAELGP